MRVLHIALGGCLVAQRVRYGLTEDTGGHIAYVLGAARAQAGMATVDDVEIVTRLFDEPDFDPIHACDTEIVTRKLRIVRLRSKSSRYLSKEDLVAEIPDLTRAFLTHLRGMTLRPDVIHAHFADAAVLGRAARRIFGIPLVYTPHSLAIDKTRTLARAPSAALDARIRREAAALTGADAVVVSSRDEAERQIAGYGLEVCGRVHRVAPGVDLPEPDDTDTAAARALLAPVLRDLDRPMILAIARPVARKNLLALARVYRSSSALRQAANLVILAGQHPGRAEPGRETDEVLASLTGILSDADLAGHVALPPRHEPSAVPQIYRLAARQRGVFVNVALHEPFGLTVLEAASHGLPCVVTNEGGPPDILAQLRSGLAVTPTDDAQIEDAIVSLLSDDALWTSASRNARAGIPAFSWSGWAAQSVRIYAALRARETAPAAPRQLLASDMDNTLTGSRDGAAAFRRWHRARTMPFVLATGRSLSEARSVLQAWDLPEPDAFVTAVGTEIHMQSARGRFEFCQDYADHLEADWDRAALLAVLRESGLPLQPDIEQRRWKVCCFGTARQALELERVIGSTGLSARVVASHDRLIDVLPIRGGKAAGVAFVADRYGLTLRDCIAAGDSGNDRDMLEAVGHPILVSNALPELRSRLVGRSVFHSSLPYAAGVLDGVAHHASAVRPRRQMGQVP